MTATRAQKFAKKDSTKGTQPDAKPQPPKPASPHVALAAAIAPDAARLAYEALEGEISALRTSDVAPRRIDMQRAASVAYTVAVRDAAPARRAEFERLAQIGRYDLATLERLPQLALAAWHVRYCQMMGQHRASAATVPEETMRRAQAVRARMLRVADYWLGDLPEVARRLEFIRAGAGYQDLANDLLELPRLYEREDLLARVTPDTPHYVAADVSDARRLAHAIFVGLGLGEESELERWASMSQRTWTLLSRAYEEHRKSGLFLFGAQEDVAATYPSLVAAVRSAPSRRAPDEPVDEPGEPSEEPDAPVEEPVDGADDGDSVNG